MRLLALSAVVFAAPSAFAFSLSRSDSNHVVKWYDSDDTLELQLNTNAPTRLRAADSPADVRAAIDRSLASWNNIPCSRIELKITSTTTDTQNLLSDKTRDQNNRIVWIEQAERFQQSSQVLGVTQITFYQDGSLVEADIALNGVDVNWAVYDNLADVPGGSTVDQATDVESVIVHELGHFIGLAHVLDGAAMSEPPTMTPTVDPQLRTRSLEADDRNGACFLYPSSGATNNPCSRDAECPQFLTRNARGEEVLSDRSTCVDDVCTKIETVPCGDGNLGDRCCTNNCASSMSCLAVAPGQTSYCVSSCNTSDAKCPDGFTCVPLSGGSASRGACLTDVVLGCDCDINDSCTSSCACDSDCKHPAVNPGSGGSGDGGCAAASPTGLWGLWVVLGIYALRASQAVLKQSRSTHTPHSTGRS